MSYRQNQFCADQTGPNGGVPLRELLSSFPAEVLPRLRTLACRFTNWHIDRYFYEAHWQKWREAVEFMLKKLDVRKLTFIIYIEQHQWFEVDNDSAEDLLRIWELLTASLASLNGLKDFFVSIPGHKHDPKSWKQAEKTLEQRVKGPEYKSSESKEELIGNPEIVFPGLTSRTVLARSLTSQ